MLTPLFKHSSGLLLRENINGERGLKLADADDGCNNPNGLRNIHFSIGGYKAEGYPPCIEIRNGQNPEEATLHTAYFVGADWLRVGALAAYVEPKLNDDGPQTDFLQMLSSALDNPEIAEGLQELYTIDWEAPLIALPQKLDLLTPLLVVEYLQRLRQLTHKGLKKGFYTVTQNLTARLKGKVLTASTIKHNHLKGHALKTWCSYNEFGMDTEENRLLKRALRFGSRYLATRLPDGMPASLSSLVGNLAAAFEGVSDVADAGQLKAYRNNPFYREYDKATSLARRILSRFGYNIDKTTRPEDAPTDVPPFWVNMAKLFELHVLALLRKQPGLTVDYQKRFGGDIPDFLLRSGDQCIIADAKYKRAYEDSKVVEDIRQLSGYARSERVLDHFGIKAIDGKLLVLPCWIIYPAALDTLSASAEPCILNWPSCASPISGYIDFHKTAVYLPLVRRKELTQASG